MPAGYLYQFFWTTCNHSGAPSQFPELQDREGMFTKFFALRLNLQMQWQTLQVKHINCPIDIHLSEGARQWRLRSWSPADGLLYWPLILTLEGRNNRDHLTFGLTLPPLPLRLTTKNSFLTKDQSSKSLFFYSDLVSYRQLWLIPEITLRGIR